MTKGKTFTDNEQVTAAKLHQLVDDATIDASEVTTAKIADAAVTNAKIATAAGIALSKIATTSGKLVGGSASNTAEEVAVGDTLTLSGSTLGVAAGSIGLTELEDASITEAKLAASLNLASKTITLAADSVASTWLQQDMIADFDPATPASGDLVLIGDVDDGNLLKKTTVSALAAAAISTPTFTSSEIAVATAVSAAHSLGRTPALMRCVLVCATPEYGWEEGDEIQMPGDGHSEVGASNTSHYVGVGCNSTGCYFSYATSIYFANRTTGAGVALTPAKWRVKFYAW